MGETWGSTEQRIALIARGSVDSRKASQLLNETFDAPDYFHILRGCSEAEAQRYINGLYEVHYYLCEYPSRLTFTRFMVTCHPIRRTAYVAFGDSGKREEEQDYFQPVTIFHPNSKHKMSCRTQPANSQMFGKRNSRTTQPALSLRLRSFV